MVLVFYCLMKERVVCWALSPASFLTSFRSDHHVVPCWLVECMMSWVRFQHLSDWNLPHLITADISHQQFMYAIAYFKGFVQNQQVFRSLAMLLFCEESMAATLRLFCRGYCVILICSTAQVLCSLEASICKCVLNLPVDKFVVTHIWFSCPELAWQKSIDNMQ